MKKILLSLIVLCCAFVAKAQNDQLTATLQHGDEVSLFTGADALAAAMEAAADGDIITLSAGTFRTTPINKSVSIFGAGYEKVDSLTIDISAIDGETTIGLAENTLHDLNFQGLRFNNLVNVGGTTNNAPIEGLTFTKVRFGNDVRYYSDITNANFDQCIFINAQRGYPDANEVNANNWLYNNCHIHSLNYFKNGSIKVDHSIFSYGTPIYNSTVPFIFTNTIFNDCYRFPGGLYPKNCIYISTNLPDGVNCYRPGYYGRDVFTDVDGFGYSETRTFEIQKPDVWVGTDGTEIGIHGGKGWSKIPATPVVKGLKLSVSGKTLNVEYEAKTR